MLSRTASDLYWMSRYLERAENLARMLDVSYSLSLMPQDGHGDGLHELAMPLLITGTLDDYLERHGELHAERLLHFFALDAANPASIYSCLGAARASAHAVRGRITADMWENINAAWLEIRGISEQGLGARRRDESVVVGRDEHDSKQVCMHWEGDCWFHGLILSL